MLKLDPSDPLGVLYLIDTYAIRARQYEFLIEFTYSKMFQDRSLSYLPNFAMHVALAKFYLEKEGAEVSPGWYFKIIQIWFVWHKISEQQHCEQEESARVL